MNYNEKSTPYHMRFQVLFSKRLEMFSSFLDTWLPFILIFSATWVKVIMPSKAPGYMTSAKRSGNKWHSYSILKRVRHKVGLISWQNIFSSERHYIGKRSQV
jgi:hypothetical protein